MPASVHQRPPHDPALGFVLRELAPPATDAAAAVGIDRFAASQQSGS